ncbi:hypothetical protein DFJ74DRAFT_688501 [Hyaloraphidium curvatum]|nr:hypothetical protein DFJ74DRAFT_688501 [Hyaloraphidium curvatum]
MEQHGGVMPRRVGADGPGRGEEPWRRALRMFRAGHAGPLSTDEEFDAERRRCLAWRAEADGAVPGRPGDGGGAEGKWEARLGPFVPGAGQTSAATCVEIPGGEQVLPDSEEESDAGGGWDGSETEAGSDDGEDGPCTCGAGEPPREDGAADADADGDADVLFAALGRLRPRGPPDRARIRGALASLPIPRGCAELAAGYLDLLPRGNADADAAHGRLREDQHLAACAAVLLASKFSGDRPVRLRTLARAWCIPWRALAEAEAEFLDAVGWRLGLGALAAAGQGDQTGEG